MPAVVGTVRITDVTGFQLDLPGEAYRNYEYMRDNSMKLNDANIFRIADENGKYSEVCFGPNQIVRVEWIEP